MILIEVRNKKQERENEKTRKREKNFVQFGWMNTSMILIEVRRNKRKRENEKTRKRGRYVCVHDTYMYLRYVVPSRYAYNIHTLKVHDIHNLYIYN